jgi:hypothetical protein
VDGGVDGGVEWGMMSACRDCDRGAGAVLPVHWEKQRLPFEKTRRRNGRNEAGANGLAALCSYRRAFHRVSHMAPGTAQCRCGWDRGAPLLSPECAACKHRGRDPPVSYPEVPGALARLYL